MQYGIENACKFDFELVKNQKIQQKINQKPQISPFFNLGIFADMGVQRSILLLDKYDCHIKMTPLEYVSVHNYAVSAQKIL